MYNSPHSDTKRLSAAWKMMLVMLSITFVWQTVITQTYPQEIATQAVASPPVPSREEVLRQQYASANFLDIVETGEKVQHNETDLFCMAKNIYHEARGEPTLGKYAVAQVTVNRVRDSRFNDTVCSVVFQPYQFTWANDISIRWTRPSGPAWNESLEIAQEVLEKGMVIKGMENALYFHANYASPDWRDVRKITKIGAHIFYKQTS